MMRRRRGSTAATFDIFIFEAGLLSRHFSDIISKLITDENRRLIIDDN